jgi:hypothetical protein
MRGGGRSCGVSANEYTCTHGAQINFGDLTPYLIYDYNGNLDETISTNYVFLTYCKGQTHNLCSCKWSVNKQRKLYWWLTTMAIQNKILDSQCIFAWNLSVNVQNVWFVINMGSMRTREARQYQSTKKDSDLSISEYLNSFYDATIIVECFSQF